MVRPRGAQRRAGGPVDDDTIIALILSHEGSAFTNDPHDAGGPTKYGITQANLASWRGHAVTIDDVRNLTRDEAAAIYRAQYIRPFDMLRGQLRVNVIDMGVNAGVRRATVLLQQMAGATVDAWIGRETLAALAVLADMANPLYVGMRIAFYEDLIQSKPKNIKWRRGWRSRALSFLEPQKTDAVQIRASRSPLRMAKAYAD